MENNKTVFVLECSSGIYDSYHTWIGGVFDSLDKANECKNELNIQAKKVKEELLFLFPNILDIFNDDIDEETEIQYNRFYAKNQKYLEWNEPIITEFILNEKR